MKFLIVLATLVVCAYSQSSTTLNWSGCGVRNAAGKRDADKIVGGTNAKAGDWAWQISLQFFGSHICGGSLINNQWILTAAHCVDGYSNPAYYTIGLGYTDLSNSNKWSKKIAVSKVIKHPSYNSRLIQNDIALIKLSSSVSFNDNLLPACFPTSASSPAINEDTSTWATGWGSLSSGGSVTNNLMQVEIPALSDDDCQTKYEMANLDSSFCAGKTGGNKDTCQGDSGGPLVTKDSNGKWNVVGITSYGYGCSDGGVYTRSSYYYDWVLSTIGSQ